MESSTFDKLAGDDGKLDAAEVREALDAEVPDSRKRLSPKVVAHADYLTTSFDLIDEPHREAGEKLAVWIAKNYKPGQPLQLIGPATADDQPGVARGQLPGDALADAARGARHQRGAAIQLNPSGARHRAECMRRPARERCAALRLRLGTRPPWP